jgi:hypothetical protein
MNERDVYQPGVLCWVAAAPPDHGGAGSTVSPIASRGA